LVAGSANTGPRSTSIGEKMSQANNELAERIQTMRRGSHTLSPRRAAASFNQITAHNSDTQHREQAAGWPSQFRCSAFVHFGATGAGSVFWPGVCEFVRRL
jgi:hypothetical protein